MRRRRWRSVLKLLLPSEIEFSNRPYINIAIKMSSEQKIKFLFRLTKQETVEMTKMEVVEMMRRFHSREDGIETLTPEQHRIYSDAADQLLHRKDSTIKLRDDKKPTYFETFHFETVVDWRGTNVWLDELETFFTGRLAKKTRRNSR